MYFDSKEELFKSVVRSGIVRAIEEAEQMVVGYEGSSADLLHEINAGWWKHIGATKLCGIPKLMFSEAQNFPELARFYYHEVIQRSSHLVAGALERGIARGESRPVNIDYAVRALFAPLIMRALPQHSFLPCVGPDNVDAPAYLAHTLDLMVDGLRTE